MGCGTITNISTARVIPTGSARASISDLVRLLTISDIFAALIEAQAVPAGDVRGKTLTRFCATWMEAGTPLLRHFAT